MANIFDTADHTAEYEEKDIQDNKAMAILAHLSILVLIPLIAAKESKFARFHTNLGLIVFFGDLITLVLTAIGTPLCAVIIGFPILFLAMIWGVAMLVLHVFGIVYAAKGQARDLPVIPGNWKILK